MLYISTRNKVDTYTAYRALHEENAADGGAYTPFRMEKITREQLEEWAVKTPGESVAQILNGFFGVNLSGWDVDCIIGRVPFQRSGLGRHTTVTECWRNPGNSWEYFISNLYALISGKVGVTEPVHGWARIAIEISLLFGIYSQLNEPMDSAVDLCVAGGDFATIVAALYAKDMGLPVGKILCVSNENSAFWDFMHKGEMNTCAAVVQTNLPELDVVNPRYFEYLLHRFFGVDTVQQYLDVCRRKGVFRLDEEALQCLNEELYATVVSTDRVDAVISRIYNTNRYIAEPVLALSFGGLQDYRSITGVGNHTLLLSKESPLNASSKITKLLNISRNDISRQINSSKE